MSYTFLFKNIAISILILALFAKQSFPRFVSEKNHDHVDRVSKDYFQERGLVLDDAENMYDQNENDVDSDTSQYFQQPSQTYDRKDSQLDKANVQGIGQEQILHMPLAVSQDKLQQMNQEKLLQQIQQYKNELQRLRMPKINNYVNNPMPLPLPNPKPMQHLYNSPDMLALMNNNQKDFYNPKYMLENTKIQQSLNVPPNIGNPMFLVNENQQPLVDLTNQESNF